MTKNKNKNKIVENFLWKKILFPTKNDAFFQQKIPFSNKKFLFQQKVMFFPTKNWSNSIGSIGLSKKTDGGNTH